MSRFQGTLRDAKEYAEFVTRAAREFEIACMKVHKQLEASGYKLLSVQGDERVYKAPPAANSGRVHEVRVPVEKPPPHVLEDIQGRLVELLPDAEISMSGEPWKGPYKTISAEIRGDFKLRFKDMPALAAIFETDHLNFQQEAGRDGHRYSSWTYDSGSPQKLFIVATYEDVPCFP